MSIRRFEDMESWQVSRTLANMIYELTKQEAVRKDYGFVDQIRRAAISVMNNIAEGYERGSNKDFAKFLFIARGSVGEVRSMLYIAKDQKYVSCKQFDDALDLAVRGSQLCWGMIKHLQQYSDLKTGSGSATPPVPDSPS